jgi:hypothetical protein
MNSENVRRHQLIPERPRVARAAAVPTAIDEQDAIAGLHQRGNLITPIAAKEEGAAQAASLALVQRDLERAVHEALQRGMVERVLMPVILAPALAVGMLTGSHLLH